MNVVCPKTRMRYRLLLVAGGEGAGGDNKWFSSSEASGKAAETEARFDSFVKTLEGNGERFGGIEQDTKVGILSRHLANYIGPVLMYRGS